MDKVVRHIYYTVNGVTDKLILKKYFKKYCNCNEYIIFEPDLDAYGEWIYCEKCKIWLGWKYKNEYFNTRGENILDSYYNNYNIFNKQ